MAQHEDVSAPRRALLGPLAALAFLTTFPLPARFAPAWAASGTSLAWFPLVGLLLGSILAAGDHVLRLTFAPLVASALIVLGLLALTGGLHADGLADTCDAVCAPVTPERRLEIMRDPRIGAFGAIGLMAMILLKVTAVDAFPPPARFGALLLGPVLGRWALVLAVSLFPYGRVEGSGLPFKSAVRPLTLILATVVAGGCALLVGPWAVVLLALAGTVTLGFGWWLMRRLPGLTGDCYGATCEVIETVVWLAAPLAYGWARAFAS